MLDQRRYEAHLAETRGRVAARDVTGWAEKERLLLEACHPRQRDFVLDPGRRVAALVARGGGKTTGDRARIVRKLGRIPKAKILFIANTRDQALELMWSPLKELVEKLGIQASFNETTLRCTFRRNGSQVRLVGADDKKQIEKYRGQPHHEVIIDEAASYPAQLLDHLIYRIIGPRLGDYGGCLVMTGTPGHHLSGPFYDVTRPGTERSRPWADREQPEYVDWKNWSFHRWSLLDGAPFVPALERLWAEALVEKANNGWTDQNPVWRREYLAEWAADDTENVFKYRPFLEDGTAWNQWDPPRIAAKGGLAELPAGFKDWQFVYGMDLGASDPYALEVFAFSPTDKAKTLYHVLEFQKRGMYARPIAELLLGEALDHDKPGGVIGATGWPDAMDADADGLGDMLLDELANVYGIRIAKAEKKNRFDAIELFNGDLVDGRIKILKGSVLEQQLGSLQWAVDEFGQLKKHKGQRDDCADAAMYARRRAAHLLAEETPQPAQTFKPGGERERPWEKEKRGEFAELLSDDGYFDDDFGN